MRTWNQVHENRVGNDINYFRRVVTDDGKTDMEIQSHMK